MSLSRRKFLGVTVGALTTVALPVAALAKPASGPNTLLVNPVPELTTIYPSSAATADAVTFINDWLQYLSDKIEADFLDRIRRGEYGDVFTLEAT